MVNMIRRLNGCDGGRDFSYQFDCLFIVRGLIFAFKCLLKGAQTPIRKRSSPDIFDFGLSLTPQKSMSGAQGKSWNWQPHSDQV